MGGAKPGKTHGLAGTGPGLAHQDSAGLVFGQVWTQTNPFVRSKPGLLAGYPDLFLTLLIAGHELVIGSSKLPYFIFFAKGLACGL